MKKHPLGWLWVAYLICFAGCAGARIARDANGAFKEGECWSYDARPGEERSLLVIRKIETLPGYGEVVHISVYGFEVRTSSGEIVGAAFLTLSPATLRASVTKKLDIEYPEIGWRGDYRRWREAFDRGGKLFGLTRSVRESLNLAQDQSNRDAPKG
jgi:hypothetical protein